MNLKDCNYFAHRGLHSKDIPENSIKAFEEAISNNIAIELDVHLTKDNYVVVYHDYNLKRLTGASDNIEDLTLNELKKLRLLQTDYSIPTLTEVLSLVSNKVPILIEIKNEGFNFRLEKEVIAILKKFTGKYLIQSFNPFSIMYFKKHAKSLLRGQLISKNKENIESFIIRFILTNNVLNFLSKPQFISYDIDSLDCKIVKKYKNKKKLVFAFTIQSKESLIKSKQLNCDGIIFDTLPLEEVYYEQ